MSRPLTVNWGCQSLTLGLEAGVTCDKVTLYARHSPRLGPWDPTKTQATLPKRDDHHDLL